MVRIEVILDDATVFAPGRIVRLIRDGQQRQATIEFVRSQHGRTVMKLSGVDAIEQAEALVGWDIVLAPAEVPPPQAGTFWSFELKGCRVEGPDGESLGIVRDILGIEEQGTPILQVDGKDGEVLIPFAQAYLKAVDLEQRRIVVELPEGLRNLNK